ncbi:MAG: hypothetical protein R2941_22545 [Desulfobacterales bacterium]
MERKDGFFKRILNAIFFSRKRDDKANLKKKRHPIQCSLRCSRVDLPDEKTISIEADNRDAIAEEKGQLSNLIMAYPAQKPSFWTNS